MKMNQWKFKSHSDLYLPRNIIIPNSVITVPLIKTNSSRNQVNLGKVNVFCKYTWNTEVLYLHHINKFDFYVSFSFKQIKSKWHLKYKWTILTKLCGNLKSIILSQMNLMKVNKQQVIKETSRDSEDTKVVKNVKIQNTCRFQKL